LAAMNLLCEHLSIASSLLLPDLRCETYSSAAFFMTLAATHCQALWMSARESEPSDLLVRTPGIPR
jgi:hypothetical protein